MENHSVYDKLNKRLAVTLTGIPRGEKFLEILRILFTPEEAEMALILPFIPAPLADIADGAGMEIEDAIMVLSNMADKGLVYAFEHRGTSMFMLFGVVWTLFKFPFMKDAPGIDYERLISLCDESLAEYPLVDNTAVPEGNYFPLERVLPINESLSVESEVLPQEMVYKYFDEAKYISVGECSCKRIVSGCDSPSEVCMSFDHEAKFLAGRKMARLIDREEAKIIHKKATEAGLVSITSNTTDKINFLCHCCPCCCALLGVATRHGLYDFAPRGAYIASVNQNECTVCGLCEEVCPMKAIEIGDTALINVERCIGCGLCILKCTSGALSLIKRSPAPDVPKNIIELTKKVLETRGMAEAFLSEIKVKKKSE